MDELITALNKIIWKLYLPPGQGLNDLALMIAAELGDSDILVHWHESTETFERG